MKTFHGLDFLIPIVFKESVGKLSRNENRKLPAFFFLVTSTLILFLTACIPTNTTSPAALPPTEQEVIPHSSDLVATPMSAEATATAIPTEVPIVLDEVGKMILYSDTTTWTPELKAKYALVFEDQVGNVTTRRVEWNKQFNAYNLEIKTYWFAQLFEVRSEQGWKDELTKYGMAVPEITNLSDWLVLDSATRNNVVAAYRISNNITWATMPLDDGATIVSSNTPFRRYQHDDGLWEGYNADKEAFANLFSRTMSALTFGGKNTTVRAIQMSNLFLTGDNIVGFNFIPGISKADGGIFWIKQQSSSKKYQHYFSFLPFTPVSLVGGIRTDSNVNLVEITESSANKDTGKIQFQIVVNGNSFGKQVSVKDFRTLELLMKYISLCKEKGCQITIYTPTFLHGIGVVDYFKFDFINVSPVDLPPLQ